MKPIPTILVLAMLMSINMPLASAIAPPTETRAVSNNPIINPTPPFLVLMFNPANGEPIPNFDKLDVILTGYPSGYPYYQFQENIPDIFTVVYTPTDVVKPAMGMSLNDTSAPMYKFTGDQNTVSYGLQLNTIPKLNPDDVTPPNCIRTEVIGGHVSIFGDLESPLPVSSLSALSTTVFIVPNVALDNVHKWDLTIYGGNGDGKMDRNEVLNAVAVWFTNPLFDRDDIIKVIELYFNQDSFSSGLTACTQ